MWENGLTPEVRARPCSLLQPHVRAAAAVLGYMQTDWDDEIPDYDGSAESDVLKVPLEVPRCSRGRSPRWAPAGARRRWAWRVSSCHSRSCQ